MKTGFFRRVSRSVDEMPFLEHLEELRWRILWSLLAVLVCTVAGYIVVSQFNVLGLLTAPLEPLLGGEKLKYLSPVDPFFLTLRLALIMGVIMAAPIVCYQFWNFVSPAMMPSEKRAIIPALYLGLFLFILGAAMAYFVVLPLALRFLMAFQVEALEPNLIAAAYLGFVVRLMLAFGLAFELPVVLAVLASLGLTSSKGLASVRRYALVASTIMASLITPGDVVSTVLLMAPLLLLYEFSILLIRAMERRRGSLDDQPVEA